MWARQGCGKGVSPSLYQHSQGEGRRHKPELSFPSRALLAAKFRKPNSKWLR